MLDFLVEHDRIPGGIDRDGEIALGCGGMHLIGRWKRLFRCQDERWQEKDDGKRIGSIARFMVIVCHSKNGPDENSHESRRGNDEKSDEAAEHSGDVQRDQANDDSTDRGESGQNTHHDRALAKVSGHRAYHRGNDDEGCEPQFAGGGQRGVTHHAVNDEDGGEESVSRQTASAPVGPWSVRFVLSCFSWQPLHGAPTAGVRRG